MRQLATPFFALSRHLGQIYLEFFFLQVMVETSESLFDDLWSVFTSIEAHSEAHVENSSETTPHKMYVESVERLQISSEQLEKILDTRWSKVKVAQPGNNKKN